MCKKVAVIGGGAAGIAAAISVARAAQQTGQVVRVVVIDRLDRVGKKILATGNGRCNLTNLHPTASCYQTACIPHLTSILAKMTPRHILDFFDSCGLVCDILPDGKVYPHCYQASMVLDVLRHQMQRLNIQEMCGFDVVDVVPQRNGFMLQGADQQRLFAHRVIVSTGGQAMPKLGSNGSGYQLMKQLGHRLTPLFPALVPLKSSSPYPKSLQGIRAKVSASMYQGAHCLGTERGELQFTSYGFSGIPAMQLSHLMVTADHPSHPASKDLVVDFLPDIAFDQVLSMLQQRQANASTVDALLLGMVHKKLAAMMLKALRLSSHPKPSADLGNIQLRQIADILKGWRFSLEGTLPFSHAQVTGGGVTLSDIDPDTMESRLHSGLYLVGELLDVSGACGGFNLHFAWGSGLLAGKSAAYSLSPALVPSPFHDSSF